MANRFIPTLTYSSLRRFETDSYTISLAKGKSLKRTDNSKLGKYGQGSKLLYTLLTEVSESEDNEDLLSKDLV